MLTEIAMFRTAVANRAATLTVSSPPVNALGEAWISRQSCEIARLQAGARV